MQTKIPPSIEIGLGCGCIILAAGGSTRLGRPKQLVEVNGSTLLERTIQAALGTTDLWPVIVVIGAKAELIRPVLRSYPVLIAENPAWSEGIASSLRVGLNTLDLFSTQIGSTLITLCDLPHISPQVFQTLLATQSERKSDLVAARYQNHPGAPALFGRKHFATLSQLTGDEGARTLFRKIPPGEITTVDLPLLSVDLDTPADFEQITGRSMSD